MIIGVTKLERYTHDDVLYAIVVKGKEQLKGMNFITPNDFPLQFGINIYKPNDSCKPHIHIPCERNIIDAQEVLHIDTGLVDIDLYDSKEQKFATVRLEGGDSIFLVAGGHGLRFVKETKIIEVKQGPYMGREADKRFID